LQLIIKLLKNAKAAKYLAAKFLCGWIFSCFDIYQYWIWKMERHCFWFWAANLLLVEPLDSCSSHFVGYIAVARSCQGE